MTLGEIKVEALRVIGVNLSEDLSEQNMDELLETEKYRSYLVNMVGPINRCLSIFLRRGVIEKPIRVGLGAKDSLELEALGLSEELSELVPFYIKYELCGMDDPDLAAQAFAFFERSLGEIMAHSGKRQERVSDVMGGLK